MSHFHNRAALSQYRGTDVHASVHTATPQQLVLMLLSAAMDRLAAARGCLMRGELSGRLAGISAAMAIIEHLRMSLDPVAGGEISLNLDALYDYMLRRLCQANAGSDGQALEEVMDVLRPIRDAWEQLVKQGIPAAAA